MILKSLTLTNFKKHARFELQFDTGLTVVRGENWAGKSTIIHGILFALFGPSAVPGKKDRLPRRGGGKLEVTLNIEVDDKDLVIRRGLNTAVVECGGEVLASGASGVETWVEATLGLDKKTVLDLAYSPQSEASSLLTLGVPALNRLVERLSKADYIERLIERAKLRATAPVAVVPDWDQDDWDAQSDAAAEDLSTAEAESTTLAGTLGELQQKVDEANENYQTTVDNNAAWMRWDAARREIEELESRKKAIPELPDPSEFEPRLEAQREIVIDFRKKQAELQTVHTRQLDDLSTQAKLEKWFDTIGADWQVLEANIDRRQELKAELVSLVEARMKARDVELALQKEYTDLKTQVDGGVCPTCERPYGDTHDLQHLVEKTEEVATRLAAAKVARSNANLAVATMEEDIAELKVPPSDYEDIYNAKADELEKIQAKVAGHRNIEEDLAQMVAHEKDAQKKLAELEVQTQKSRERLLKLASIEQNIEKLSKAASATEPAKPVDVQTLKAGIARWNEDIQAMRTRIKALDNAAAQSRAKIAALDAALARHTELTQQVARHTAQAALYKRIAGWLGENKARLLGTLWDAILDSAGSFLSEATEGYATALTRSDAGEFSVTEDGEESVVSSCSGGMRAIAGTALKLSLSELLPNAPQFVLLDEISAELNDINAGRLAMALSGHGRQTVLVTHRTGEEYLAGTVVML